MHNIQQQTVECVEVYYERMLKLANCLQVRTKDVFLTTVFKACLLLYLRLITAGMKRNILIERKKIVVICKESGHVSLSYNVLLITP